MDEIAKLVKLSDGFYLVFASEDEAEKYQKLFNISYECYASAGGYLNALLLKTI